VGNDDYNKLLSGRRAAAIYGMLTRRDEAWEDLFSNTGIFAEPVAGDKWGDESIQTMLGELVQPTDGTDPLKQFQSDNGLAPDGKAGPATRKQLFLAYMDLICVDDSGSRSRWTKRQDFWRATRTIGEKGISNAAASSIRC
jgi:hypothetical protein